MKILVISNMYPTDNHLSFGIFVKNQVEALRRSGIDVELAVNDNPATGKKNVLVKYSRWGLQALRQGVKHRKTLAVTHAHYAFPSGMLSLMLKRLFKIPYIVTAHGGDIERMARKSARLFNWTEAVLANSEHVIAVGPVLADQIENDFSIPREKISIISMGVNREVFYPVPREYVRAELNIKDDEFHYLFVGNVIEQKGVEELVQAFQMVKTISERRVKLTIIGAQRDAEFIKRLQPFVDEDVQFIDPLPQTSLVKWFQASDVFVLPSHLEGFGLVALEALAAGTPVIASEVGGLVSLLKQGAGHLVPPRNAPELAKEMKRVLNVSREDYYNAPAVEPVLDANDERAIVKRLSELYKTAAEGGRKQ